MTFKASFQSRTHLSFSSQSGETAMSSAAPSQVLLQTNHGPHGRQSLPNLPADALHAPLPPKPANLSVTSPPPEEVPGTADTDAHASYPEVPPESPLPMHARAFDFVGMRDIFGFLSQGRRHQSPPALTAAAAPPSAVRHG
jgi:hypothetical protein